MVKTRSNLNTSTSLALKRSKRTITTATKKPINKRKKKSSVIKNNKVNEKINKNIKNCVNFATHCRNSATHWLITAM